MTARPLVPPAHWTSADEVNRRLRILHVAPAFYPATYWGGPTFSTYGLCNALAQRPDIDLTVLTTDTAGPATNDRVAVDAYPTRYEAGYDVYFVRKSRRRDIAPALIPELWRLSSSADVIHLTATYSFPSLPTMAVARMRRIPLLWSPRGAIQAAREWDGARRQRLKWIWERAAQKLLPKATLMHVTAEVEREACEHRLPGHPSVVIPNGIDVPPSLPERAWRPEGRLRLMYLSRLDVKKGLENMFEALVRLPQAVTLDIYGTGAPDYFAALKAHTARLGVDDRITFHGHVEGADKQRAFLNADAFVLPSFSENFGIVTAEALAHGVPVIASRATPWAEVEVRGCGLWVDNTPDALAAAVRTLLEADDLSLMGARGRAWMVSQFSWDCLAGQMADAYRFALSLNSTTTPHLETGVMTDFANRRKMG